MKIAFISFSIIFLSVFYTVVDCHLSSKKPTEKESFLTPDVSPDAPPKDNTEQTPPSNNTNKTNSSAVSQEKVNKSIILATKIVEIMFEFMKNVIPVDADRVSTTFKSNSSNFKFKSKIPTTDKKEAILMVKKNGLTLQSMSDQFRRDKDIVLHALQQNVSALQYADKSLTCNKEFGLSAVKLNGLALQYFSDELRDDPQIFLMAVEQNILAIQYASERLIRGPPLKYDLSYEDDLCRWFDYRKLDLAREIHQSEDVSRSSQ